jgi:hypothetical protein
MLNYLVGVGEEHGVSLHALGHKMSFSIYYWAQKATTTKQPQSFLTTSAIEKRILNKSSSVTCKKDLRFEDNLYC